MPRRRKKAVVVRVWKRKWEYPKGSGIWKEAWTITYIDRNGNEKRTSPHPDSRDDTRLAADEVHAKVRDKTFVGDSDTVSVEEAQGVLRGAGAAQVSSWDA